MERSIYRRFISINSSSDLIPLRYTLCEERDIFAAVAVQKRMGFVDGKRDALSAVERTSSTNVNKIFAASQFI